MGLRWGTTWFKCRIAINIVPFLLSAIFIRIRVFIAKSQIYRRIWHRPTLHCVGKASSQTENLDISLCDGIGKWYMLCLLTKTAIGWMVFWFPPKSERHLARNFYPSCETPHTRYTTNMMDPTFILVNHFAPKIMFIRIFLMSAVKCRLWN